MSRVLTINFTTSPPVVDSYAGEIGEHKAVTLKVLPDTNTPSVTAYTMFFAVEGGLLPSRTFSASESIEIELTSELTQQEILECQLVGLEVGDDATAHIIAKSPVVKLCLGESLVGETVVDPSSGDTIFDEIAELKAIADELDMTQYYKKTETYSRDETYSKAEVDTKVGDSIEIYEAYGEGKYAKYTPAELHSLWAASKTLEWSGIPIIAGRANSLAQFEMFMFNIESEGTVELYKVTVYTDKTYKQEAVTQGQFTVEPFTGEQRVKLYHIEDYAEKNKVNDVQVNNVSIVGEDGVANFSFSGGGNTNIVDENYQLIDTATHISTRFNEYLEPMRVLQYDVIKISTNDNGIDVYALLANEDKFCITKIPFSESGEMGEPSVATLIPTSITDISDAADTIMGYINTFKTYADSTYAKSSDIPDDKIAYVTYGSTTYAEVTALIEAGKEILCVYEGNYYRYTTKTGTSTINYWFTALTNTTNTAYVRVSNKDAWSNGTNSLFSSSNIVVSGSEPELNDGKVYSCQYINVLAESYYTAEDIDGLLEEKQDTLTIDSTVTEESGNPVSGKAVASYHDTSKMDTASNTGTTGQVLTKTDDGAEWQDASGGGGAEISGFDTSFDTGKKFKNKTVYGRYFRQSWSSSQGNTELVMNIGSAYEYILTSVIAGNGVTEYVDSSSVVWPLGHILTTYGKSYISTKYNRQTYSSGWVVWYVEYTLA